MNKRKKTKKAIDAPWSIDYSDVLSKLKVNSETGLTTGEVKKRKKKYGLNKLREAKPKSAWEILFNQIKNIIIYLLIVATVLSFLFSEVVEGFAILIVILINTAIGFYMEFKAVRTMESLRKLGKFNVNVRRNSRTYSVPADQIVPGDIVIIESGDVISADVRLIEASKMQANESILTGESTPVGKTSEKIDEDAPLAERSNMLFKGTAVTRGSGEAVVTATGMDTELGTISSLVEDIQEEEAPLQKKLDVMGQKLVWVTLVVATMICVLGVLSGRDLFLIVETAIALAVATVPEGLPIVATIALARGMWRMAKKNALVNKLSSVETLGSAAIIITDKTGTLTENQMTVKKIIIDDGDIDVTGTGLNLTGEFIKNNREIKPQQNKSLHELLQVGVLCSNAALDIKKGKKTDSGIGDPMEVALLVSAEKSGIKTEELRKELPEAKEEAFDADTKMMATYHRKNSKYYIAVKGAPEAVLDVSTKIGKGKKVSDLDDKKKQEWLDKNKELAGQGYRVLAVASKTTNSTDENPYSELKFIGLICLEDPIRENVREAIEVCHKAGIRVIMATGDQKVTAEKIAQQLNLLKSDNKYIAMDASSLTEESLSKEKNRQEIIKRSIYARITPKNKMDLIDLFQQDGSVVAMLGDGVNDAPALKKADIGIAMGMRGTQVAKEASDMVLQDDNFSTVVEAIKQGRIIFNNIRKFVLFLLSCNLSEILVLGVASMIDAPLPILPLQILFLNLVTDVFPALALGVGEGDQNIMNQKPRDPNEPVINRANWHFIIIFSILISISVLGSLAIALIWLGKNNVSAVTISFLTLAFAQLWHVFNMRDSGSNLWVNEITKNKWVWGALLLCIGLLCLAVYMPVLSDVLNTVNPGKDGWIVIIAMSLFPVLIGQIIHKIKFSTGKHESLS